MTSFMTFGFLIGFGMWTPLGALFDAVVGGLVVHPLVKRIMGAEVLLKRRIGFVALYALAKFVIAKVAESVPSLMIGSMLFLEWGFILIAILIQGGIAVGLAKLVYGRDWRLSAKFGISYVSLLAAVLAASVVAVLLLN